MAQLRLKRWPFCHSLCLNLCRWHGKLTPAEMAEIEQAAGTLPELQYLHIIGRPQVPLKKTGVEGVLVSILAKLAPVLTLDVKTIQMPLDLPNLQHLVLNFGATFFKGDREDSWGPSLSISVLKGLKTLYVQSFNNTITQPIDLAKCVHLQHFAVQNTQLEGSMALPKGCRLRLLVSCSKIHIGSAVAVLVGGVTIHTSLACFLSLLPRERGPLNVCWTPPHLRNLRQLRLVLSKGDLGGGRSQDDPQLEACVLQSVMPDLEVLEINAPCNLSVYISPEIRLKSFVFIAAGTLGLNVAVWQQLGALDTTVKKLYLQSSCDFWPSSIIGPPWNAEYSREGQHCWKARMPANFQSNSL